MVWYADGSIQVEANGQVATGTGTAFLKNVRIGDGLTIAGSASMHEVTNIASDTQLTFSPPFDGAAGAGKQYRIAPIQGYVKEAADRLREVLREVGPLIMSEALQALAEAQTDQERRAAVGLGKVDNTADVDKPLSTAASQAIEKKADKTALGNASTRTVTANPQDVTAGRLLQVGDFGLGVPVNLVTPNLNTISAPGFYYCNSQTNGPSTANGYLIVESASSNYVKQTFTAVDSDNIWYRRIFNGAALSWIPIKTSKNAISSLVGTFGGTANRIFLDVPSATDSELTANFPYASALEIRETNLITTGKAGSADYAPGISLHYGGYAINKLWMATSGNLFWGQAKVITSADGPALIERGTNANGTYLKFDNGEMICYAKNATSRPANSAWGSLFLSSVFTLTFPAAFIAAPAVSPTSEFDGAGSIAWPVLQAVNASNVSMYTMSGVNSGSARTGYFAFGRWKA
ncbi:hypothetical protein IB239_21890 [Pseudomonas sp. PDM12]|uniref:pyocin knob domain-containing protein n=1 Tax=Pseudomonas sp. PDM12 TaxID=2769260 RepID=UPI0017804FB9|nr:pyocin knob domain-containing protein [Pseudomonas sp. PDM12]MBD9657488.1 hypothetical protein [Pseudomonas sp. PDM12]